MAALPVYDDPAKAYWLDSKDYDGLADRFLAGSAYNGSIEDPVELFRTPVYPAFLALIYELGGKEFGNVAVAQLALGGVSTLILYSMIQRIAPEKAAFGMASVYALDPSSMFWATNVMSETVFTFFLVLALYALSRWWATDELQWTIGAGGLVGIATLVRPIGAVLLPVWGAFVLLRASRSSARFGERRAWVSPVRLGGFAIFSITVMVVLLPYMVYNKQVWGNLTISSVDTYNLGRYHAAPLLVEGRGLNLEDALDLLGVSTLPQPGDRDRFLAVISEYPLPYIRRFIEGDLIVLFWPEYHRWFGLLDIPFTTRGALGELKAGRWLGAIRSLAEYVTAEPLTGVALVSTVGYQLLLYALAVRGLVRGYRHSAGLGDVDLWLGVLAATALALLLTPGPVGEQRFRVPAQPALVLLAAYSWMTLGGESTAGTRPPSDCGLHRGSG